MQELDAFLLNVPIFSDLPDESLKKIATIGKIKKFSKNDLIFSEKESGLALCVIVQGKVKVVRGIEGGKEVILVILNQSDFFGEMAILDGLSRSASIIAMEDSEIFMIERTDFLDLLTRHQEITINILRELTFRLRQADIRIKALSLKDAAGKVASVILQIAEYEGMFCESAVVIDKLPVQQDLAKMAGTSRETVSRTLQNFVKKGFLEIEGGGIKILQYEKFKELYG